MSKTRTCGQRLPCSYHRYLFLTQSGGAVAPAAGTGWRRALGNAGLMAPAAPAGQVVPAAPAEQVVPAAPMQATATLHNSTAPPVQDSCADTSATAETTAEATPTQTSAAAEAGKPTGVRKRSVAEVEEPTAM